MMGRWSWMWVLVLWVASGGAGGFTVREAVWNESDFPVVYWIDPAVRTETEGGVGEQLIPALFDRWSNLPSSKFSAVLGGIKPGVVGQDGECCILWADLGADLFSPTAIAYTHSANGRIVDVDIVFNNRMGWSERTLTTTGLHEIGHLIGLGHSASRYAMMYATSDADDLHWDDIEGITHLYPADHLADLIGIQILYPLYASPSSAGPMAARIENAGDPFSGTVEVTMYVSETPVFEGTYLGKAEVWVDSGDPVEVLFPRVAFGAPSGPRFLGLEVDSSHKVFERDESNNLLVQELPIVPFETNADADLNGQVGGRDLFHLALKWRTRTSGIPELERYDFGRKYWIEETDLIGLLERWGSSTLP